MQIVRVASLQNALFYAGQFRKRDRSRISNLSDVVLTLEGDIRKNLEKCMDEVLACFYSDELSFEMIHFMLNGLSDEAGELAALLAERFVAIAHVDAFIALCRARAGKREAAFLRLVRAGGMLRDFGIDEHADAVAVEHGKDADALANHVRCEADAVVGVCEERVRKVAGNGKIVLRRGAGGTGEEDGIVKDGLLHDDHLLSHKRFLLEYADTILSQARGRAQRWVPWMFRRKWLAFSFPRC